jgi:hypothetical protein
LSTGRTAIYIQPRIQASPLSISREHNLSSRLADLLAQIKVCVHIKTSAINIETNTPSKKVHTYSQIIETLNIKLEMTHLIFHHIGRLSGRMHKEVITGNLQARMSFDIGNPVGNTAELPPSSQPKETGDGIQTVLCLFASHMVCS